MALIEPGKKAPWFSLPDQAAVLGMSMLDSKSKAKLAAKYVKVDGHAEEVLAAVQAL